MGINVDTDYKLGGKFNLPRAKIDQLCQILGIRAPQGRLPTGERIRYSLVLTAKTDVPKQSKQRKKKKR
jgi:hypothetical protein